MDDDRNMTNSPIWTVTYRAPNVRITVAKHDTFGPVARYDVVDHQIDGDGEIWRYEAQTWFQTNHVLGVLGVEQRDRATLLDGHSVTIEDPTATSILRGLGQ